MLILTLLFNYWTKVTLVESCYFSVRNLLLLYVGPVHHNYTQLARYTQGTSCI